MTKLFKTLHFLMREVVVIAVGDSGSGKSSFGNLYLRKECFNVSALVDVNTRNPIFNSNEIDNMIRTYFDTEGHCDGNSADSQQIQKLALYLREKNPLVNGFVIVLNGQCPRFTQGVKDLIKFAYTSFGGNHVLDHFCVVFTRIYSNFPNLPNRKHLENEYRWRIMNYISEISGISQIPDVPIFFTDCDDPEGSETKSKVDQFHGQHQEIR